MFLSGIKFATKKSSGSTQNNRKALPKYLGIKKFSMEYVKPGEIIITQRGTKWHCGDNVFRGRTFTLHAKEEGFVIFKKDIVHHFGAFRDDLPFEEKQIYKNHFIKLTNEATDFDCKIRHRFKNRNYIHVINPFTHPECFAELPTSQTIDLKKFRPLPNATELINPKVSQLDCEMSPFFPYVQPKFELRRALLK
eukprot:NODE_9_length_64580_cov_1.431941.p41 type:complete len:194 gc:universal NODE_9_length_64580_cov_1.431941:58412-57831(-)